MAGSEVRTSHRAEEEHIRLEGREGQCALRFVVDTCHIRGRSPSDECRTYVLPSFQVIARFDFTQS
jgi:hypothetical protein